MKVSRDQNEPEIIAALVAAGCLVQPLAQAMGAGVPDLLVATPRVVLIGGRVGRLLWLCEVKNGALDPNKRRLNPEQSAWHAAWSGAPVYRCESVKAALDALADVVAM